MGGCILYRLLLECFFPFCLGACWFSFSNTAARRFCEGRPPLAGRSRCPACGAVLGPVDLVPVLSWLFLRGRCRRCGAPIPLRELVTELLGGAAALLCRWRYGAAVLWRHGLCGLSWAALLALAVCGLLLSVSLIDAETLLIPDGFCLCIGAAALASLPLAAEGPLRALPARLAGALCVSVPLWLLERLCPGSIGAGDAKLMAAAGLLLGWQRTLAAFWVAVVACGAVCTVLLLARRVKRGTRIALGPYLAGGIVVMLLFGDSLLQPAHAFTFYK